jgi:outer membrane lipopolysaccharide assembly protein LptE/RlpB
VRTTLLFLLLLALCSLLPGCGYRPIARDSESRFGEGKTVSIPLFANKTYRPNLENILLNNLVDEFSRRRGLRIVEKEASDYTLSGDLLSYDKNAVSYTGKDIVKEYTAVMSLTATLRKNSTQRIVWRGTLSWSQDFPASSDIAFQQNSEDAAVQEICRRLAQQLYLKISEDF